MPQTKLVATALGLLLVLSPFANAPTAGAVGDAEFTGTLEADLVANTEDMDQVTFRPVKDLARLKTAKPLEQSENITAGRLHHPPLDRSAILAVLVEPEDEAPYLYADLNIDGTLAEDERFELRRGEEDNPYILEASLKIPFKGTLFSSYPIVVKYYKGVRWEDLKAGERLVLQSKDAYARGTVDIAGKKTMVGYGFNSVTKKLAVTRGWVGLDGDGDGEIQCDRFSPECADAEDETVIFRLGSRYVSTKKVDLEKNQIIMREHPASDYKRVELTVGAELPDFTFTDFDGKKRKLSEFRGKYVLLDFWATWCPPCIREVPYHKAAYSRFQDRGFEILGMNNDPDFESVKEWLRKNGLTWPQAQMESIESVKTRYRIHLFPTTLLLGPDGKIVSLGQEHKKQKSLRGRDLLEALDEILPP